MDSNSTTYVEKYVIPTKWIKLDLQLKLILSVPKDGNKTIAQESLERNYLWVLFQRLEFGLMVSRSTRRLAGSNSDKVVNWYKVRT